MASDLEFIKDVIYGLKREYGFPALVCRDSVAVDLATGVRATTQLIRKSVSRIIFLPMSWKKYMAQRAKGGITEFGKQEVLVDKADLDSGFEFKSGDYIIVKGRRIDVGEVDNYEYAFIVYAGTLEGLPLA